MTRFLRAIVYNWPLKLGAVGLASLLYAGVVVSQTARTFNGSVPIETADQSSDVVVLSDLGAVTSIRYVVPDELGLRVDNASFKATVSLANVDPKGGPVALAVRVAASDPRVQVLEYTPSRITVTLDRVTTRSVPVRPVIGTVPAGFEVGDPVVDEASADVTGPEAVVGRVAEVQARVTIDPSGIDLNRVVDLLPVDANGNPLSPVDVEPRTAHVRVAVFTNRRTRTLPVTPVVTGTPAAGFELASITVDPISVSVEGDANDLAGLNRADTLPISISGASSDVVQTIGFALPDGVQVLGAGTATVTVKLRAVTAARTFEAGLVLVGARSDRTYDLSTPRVLVTIAGSVADLDRLASTSIALNVDVAGLDLGAHSVAPTANLTTGLSLIAISPASVTVTVGSPASSSSPQPSP